MKSRGFFPWLSRTLAALVVLAAGVGSTRAATIAVTTTTDERADPGPGDGCSLREAIESVNGAADYGGCVHTGAAYGTGDTIHLSALTYTIAIPGPDEFLNATGSFDLLNSVALVGDGALSTIVDGGTLDRVFFIDGPYTVTVSGITITNGLSGGSSGIHNNLGTLTLLHTTITGNTASGGGACGGGIGTSLGSPVIVSDSTISGNAASYCGGGIITWSSLTLTNSTVSGNIAGGYGGGIFRGASGSGASLITNSTISANSATNGGGIYSGGGDQVTLSNSVVATQTVGADCLGGFTSNGHNLESAVSCGFSSTGDLQNTDPLLGTLGDNGGPTQTMALSAGSPAINAGSCEQAHDQRGVPRPQGSGCDMGAFEWTLPLLFADGFETGDWTSWSSAQP